MSRATVISIGAGCTGDLAAWEAAVKIAIDPLLEAYRELDMLVHDTPQTVPTVYLSAPIEDAPVIGATADLLLCRNALDHMPNPDNALHQMWHMLKPNGLFFLSVDIGGGPTPDEPTVFTEDGLLSLIESRFALISDPVRSESHSAQRDFRVTLAARKKGEELKKLDRRAVLSAYQDRVENVMGVGAWCATRSRPDLDRERQ